MKSYNIVCAFSILLVSVSCEIGGVENNNSNSEIDVRDSLLTKVDSSKMEGELASLNTTLKAPKDTVQEISYPNGVKIAWLKKGEGDSINLGDVLRIDYAVSLEDGKIYDGNHLIRKSNIVFPSGWNLQTEGWTFALTKMRIGDEVEVFLPSDLARGKMGIPGIVPPDANNLLHLEVLEKIEPIKNMDGVKVYLAEKNKEEGSVVEENSVVDLNYFASSESKARYENTYSSGAPIQLQANSNKLPEAVFKALIGTKVFDKLYIHVPAEKAYGSKGLKGKVKPNEDVFYDLIINGIK